MLKSEWMIFDLFFFFLFQNIAIDHWTIKITSIQYLNNDCFSVLVFMRNKKRDLFSIHFPIYRKNILRMHLLKVYMSSVRAASVISIDIICIAFEIKYTLTSLHVLNWFYFPFTSISRSYFIWIVIYSLVESIQSPSYESKFAE